MLFLKKNKPKPVSTPPENWIPTDTKAALEDAGYVPEDTLVVKHNRRAKRLSLRVDVKRQRVVLTFPASATWRQAHDFVGMQQDWILTQLMDVTQNVIPLTEGVTLPVLGVQHEIASTGKLRGTAYREAGKLYVSGTPEHVERRVQDYLKKEARFEISWRAREKAEQIDKTISRIRIGDTTSRWGSCSSGGVLSFSWRLILAPETMLDYVVAHEVAHLEYMDHSKAFWALCDELTESDVPTCRRWFKQNGAELFTYGER